MTAASIGKVALDARRGGGGRSLRPAAPAAGGAAGAPGRPGPRTAVGFGPSPYGPRPAPPGARPHRLDLEPAQRPRSSTCSRASCKPLGFTIQRTSWIDADGVAEGEPGLPPRPGPRGRPASSSATPTASPSTRPGPRRSRALERDGAIHGRGVADTKGFLAAAVTAACRTRAGKQPLTLLFTADEEVGCLGAKQAVAEGRVRPRHAIVGEPTCLVPVRAHKGYCAVEVELTGLEGHSAYPDVGASAIHAVGRLFAELERIGGVLEAEPDPAFDPPYTTWNVGVIQGGKARNIIAGELPLHLRVAAAPGPGPAPRAAPARGGLPGARRRRAATRSSTAISPLEYDAAAVTAPDAEIVRFLEAESGNAGHHRPLRHRAARRSPRWGPRAWSSARATSGWPTGPASTCRWPSWSRRAEILTRAIAPLLRRMSVAAWTGPRGAGRRDPLSR